MDENLKIVCLAFIQAIITIASYYFGYRRGNNNSKNIEKGENQ